MGRRLARRLLPGVVGLSLAGCRLDTSAGPGVPPLPPLDLTAAQEAAKAPPPPRPAEPKVPTPQPGRFGQRLEVPPEIPGANTPPLRLPPPDPARREERDRIIAELYANLPPLPRDPVPTEGPRVSLTDLQNRAMATHPTIRQAAAAVESARGNAIQVGLPPNPSFGFEADTIGSGGTAGQQGAKYEQLIKTAGKLRLAQAAALVDVVNAQVALRRAQIDLATNVRSGYFAVLVAEENLRLAHALGRFAEAMYRVQVDQVRGGQAAAYEPLTMRALAEQARLTLNQARNRYQAAWRQLAAAVGDPDLGPVPLAGSAFMEVPDLDYDAVRGRMLAQHTDLLTAANNVIKARYTLRSAQVTPIPDVSLKLVVQKDYTTPPFYTTANVEVGVPVPVWDRNQGGIKQAGADLARSIDDIPRARLDLLNRLADAAERYQSNRLIVDAYLKQILPDQVRAYRGVVQRSQQEPDRASFGDIVTAQQQLNTYITTYLTALQAQWQAVVDVAALAQLDDLYLPADATAGPGCGPLVPAIPRPVVLPALTPA
ncbi:MAG TPA: TolC family protein, partial [Gemmataceae bacterium]